jgi:hypothetical protein
LLHTSIYPQTLQIGTEIITVSIEESITDFLAFSSFVVSYRLSPFNVFEYEGLIRRVMVLSRFRGVTIDGVLIGKWIY